MEKVFEQPKFSLQEAMRLYPVTGDGTNRITTKDIMLGQYLIPKGTMVWVPFSAMFNSPHNFSRVDEYVPVRYSPPLLTTCTHLTINYLLAKAGT